MSKRDWVSELEEPGTCSKCGARTQLNTDNEVVHARAGTIECPSEPLSEAPVQALLNVLRDV